MVDVRLSRVQTVDTFVGSVILVIDRTFFRVMFFRTFPTGRSSLRTVCFDVSELPTIVALCQASAWLVVVDRQAEVVYDDLLILNQLGR